MAIEIKMPPSHPGSVIRELILPPEMTLKIEAFRREGLYVTEATSALRSLPHPKECSCHY